MDRANITTRGTPATIVRTKFSTFRSRVSPLNLLFIGLALCFFWVVVGELKLTARYSDFFYLKATLTQQDSGNAGVIGKYAARAETIIADDECRSDVIDGGLTFVMRDLDLQNSVDRYDAWAAAMTRADRYVTHALSCNPANGDLWARLAMIRQASSENAEQLSALMSQSALLAPSEIYVLRARFFVWRKATAATLDRASDTVDRDIRTVLNYAEPNDIVDVLGNAGANLRAHILAAAKFIPAGRLVTLKKLHVDPAKL